MKARWKNLRDAYRKLMRKQATDNRPPRWPYFKRLEFLHEVILKVPPRGYDIILPGKSEECEENSEEEGASNNSDDDPLSVTAQNLKHQVDENYQFSGT